MLQSYTIITYLNETKLLKYNMDNFMIDLKNMQCTFLQNLQHWEEIHADHNKPIIVYFSYFMSKIVQLVETIEYMFT